MALVLLIPIWLIYYEFNRIEYGLLRRLLKFLWLKDLVVFTLFGTMIIEAGFRGNHVLKIASIDQYLVLSVSVLFIGLMSFYLGIRFGNKFALPKVHLKQNQSTILTFFWISMLSTVVVGLIDGLPQKYFFQGLSETEILRFRLLVHYNGSPTFLRIVLSKILGTLTVLSLFSRSPSVKGIRFLSLYQLIGFCAMLYIYTLDLSKSQFVLFLVGIIFVRLKNTPLTLTRLAFLLMLLLVLLFAIFYNLTGNIVEAADYLLKRIFVSQISGYFLSVKIWSEGIFEQVSPSYFLRQIAYRIDGQPHYPPGRLMMMYAYPQGFANGTANYLSTIFVGEAFAIARFLGVVFFSFYVGFTSILVYRYSYLHINGLSDGILAVLIIFNNVSSSLLPFVFNPRYIVAFGFVYILSRRYILHR